MTAAEAKERLLHSNLFAFCIHCGQALEWEE